MNHIKCKINSGLGIIYSLKPLDITCLDETFPCINRNRYVGLSVHPTDIYNSDIIYIAHHSIVRKSFKKNKIILEEDRIRLQTTANWMLPYEETCLRICKDILGIETFNKTLYSMDLPRFLERIIENEILQKKTK